MFRSKRPKATTGADTATAEVDRSAREDALKLLDRQRYTRRELTRKLRDKGHESAEIEAMLDRLAAVGLVDDAEYARAFIAGRWGRRAAGWRKIETDLRGRGVSGEDIAAAKTRFEADQGGGVIDETGAAQKVVEQAARRFAALDPRLRRQRLTALLLRRGFAYETIEQVLRANGSSGR